MDNIDVVLYINLKHRTDRDAHFLKEICKLTTDLSKVQRIDAIYEKRGYIGCTKSHIKALDLFISNPEWNRCLICEDDFTLRCCDLSTNNGILSELTNQDNWDVILMAYNLLESSPTTTPSVVRVLSAQTTSGYCLQKSFALTLRTNYQESLEHYALDQFWKQLQPRYNWFTTIPSLGFQCESFSDIEMRNVDYKC